MRPSRSGLRARAGFALTLALLLGACSSPTIHVPGELPPSADQLKFKQVWSAQVGEVDFGLEVKVVGQTLAMAGSDGTVAVIDARTGQDIWRGTVAAALAAGVGHDGRLAAVITRDNELVTLEAGRELWRERLGAQSFTSPLVAGNRIFVLGADRSVTAFDGQSGRRLWQQQRPGEALVLRQAGVLLAVGDTLVVGLSGKLVGLNPLNGSVRWEVPIASPRGTNDVERLVDLVAHASRSGDVVCARAFQAAVGCVDAAQGKLLWSRPANGFVGLQGDEGVVFGVEADSTVLAWQRSNGERAWSMEQLRYYKLGEPLVTPQYMLVADAKGLLHFLSRTNGATLARLSADESPVVATPVLVDDTLVVVSRSGAVFGFRPQ